MVTKNTEAKKTKSAAPKAAKPAKTAAAPKAAPAVETKSNEMGKRRQITGVVHSDKMQKTIVVKVDRRVRHGLYQKYVTRSVKYKAHDEKNSAKVGDLVSLVESRPLSAQKRWVLQNIIRRAGQQLNTTA